MAEDLTRKGNGHEKKKISIASSRLQLADVLGLGTAALNLFNLPPHAIVTDAYIIVDNATQAAVTCDFGFAGGSELINDADMATTGVRQAAEVATLTTLTGTCALTSGALTGVVTTLTGTVTALTLNEGTPNTLASGTVALTSGALTGTVTTLTGTAALTSGAGTVVKAPKLTTGTGKVVTAKFSAEPDEAFDATFVVEFVEYRARNGELMPVTAS